MKFIIVTNYYYPEIGAAPNRITNLAEGLAERSHIVEVICPLPNYPKGKIYDEYKKKSRTQEARNSVTINRYWVYPSISKNPFLRIISMFSFAVSLWAYFFKQERIQNADWIIIQNSPLLASFSAILLFKILYRKKVALNISDLWPLSALELGAVKRGISYRLLEWIERFNYRNADQIIGQSQEILDHVYQITRKPGVLYRNVPRKREMLPESDQEKSETFKIIYAGLLGVAQGVYGIVKQIDFSKIGVQFEIFGHGNEQEKIVNFLQKNPGRGVVYKGSLSKSELEMILPYYQGSIVPLVTRLKGAVPSKIFELMMFEVPILFSGSGEGAEIVEQYHVGFTSPTKDYMALRESMVRLKKLSKSERKMLRDNCRKASKEVFSFEKQISNLIGVLSK